MKAGRQGALREEGRDDSPPFLLRERGGNGPLLRRKKGDDHPPFEVEGGRFPGGQYPPGLAPSAARRGTIPPRSGGCLQEIGGIPGIYICQASPSQGGIYTRGASPLLEGRRPRGGRRGKRWHLNRITTTLGKIAPIRYAYEGGDPAPPPRGGVGYRCLGVLRTPRDPTYPPARLEG